MLRKLSLLFLALLLISLSSCSSTLEEVNRGAESVGETGGKVMRVPGSVSEGVAGGLAGESDSNPYGR